jgi:hypothetical protein
MTQLDFDFGEGGTEKMRKKFIEFHNENPWVYRELRRLALGLKKRGRGYYGIGALFEVLRYERAMTTTDDEFKLNNNHRAFYARLLMRNESQLDGFFALRTSAADGMNYGSKKG